MNCINKNKRIHYSFTGNALLTLLMYLTAIPYDSIVVAVIASTHPNTTHKLAFCTLIYYILYKLPYMQNGCIILIYEARLLLY